MTVAGARILVADDQRDVATTLTAELRGTGAVLAYATDGEEALRLVRRGGFDLLILDMKMSPGDWGGLWVLSRLRELGITLPVIVLSGEGGQRQTIEAMRLGARDWVDKRAAGGELLGRCDELLADVRHDAVELAARTLPGPVAHSFERYAAAPEGDRAIVEGLRALEDVVKFAALVGLAARPQDARGIPGVQATQLARPSLGTWMTVARALVQEGHPEAPAATWLAALLPERRSVTAVQELVTLRNDIAHAGHDATKTQANQLRECLADVSHRLSAAWRWQLHVVTSMDYDGASFDVRTRLHAGTSSATPSAITSTNPLRSGTVILTEPDGRSLPLGPWFELVDADSKGVVGLYDSAPIPRQDNGTDTPLRYTDNASRSRGLVARSADATWYRVRHHVDRP